MTAPLKDVYDMAIELECLFQQKRIEGWSESQYQAEVAKVVSTYPALVPLESMPVMGNA